MAPVLQRAIDDTMPAKRPNALLHGSLDALILKTLAGGPRHGYAIAKFIEAWLQFVSGVSRTLPAQ